MGGRSLQFLGSAARKWCGTGGCWRRLVGVALVAGFAALLLPFWHPVYRFSSLLQLAESNQRRGPAVLRETPIVASEEGYDGQFYAQLACDPSLRAPELRKGVDTLSYRGRRILLPAVAWALGLGRPERALEIFPWLNLACWLALAWLLWPLLQADRRWLGVAAWAGVMFSAGALASVRFALTDLPALLLYVLALRAATAGRAGRMAGWLGASLLARETMLVGVWGLGPEPGEKPARLARAAGWLALAVLPLALWFGYIHGQVGGAAGGQRNFTWPLAGLIGRWRESWSHLGAPDEPALAWTSFLATIAVTAQLAFLLSRCDWRNRWWRAGAGFAVLALLLGSAVWEGFPGAAPRVLLPLLLACNVLALERRGAALWLLVLNLSVPSGLMEMRAPASADDREIAVARVGGGAAVLRVGEGCYAPEALGKDRWVWTGQDARWPLRLWADGTARELVLTVRVRALDERELVISCPEGELWRGRVGRAWTPVRLRPLALRGGEVTLLLHSDSPGVSEGPGAAARRFSVCLLNPRLELRPRSTTGPGGRD